VNEAIAATHALEQDVIAGGVAIAPRVGDHHPDA
jgi:hypothetical protein